VPKVILVTGSAGFIGSHLVARFLADGHQVIGIDNLGDFYDIEIKFSGLEKYFSRDKILDLYNSIKTPLNKYHEASSESIFDAFEQKEVKSIKSDKYTLYGLDLCDYKSLKKVFEGNKITHIVNLAALAGVRPSMEKPTLYWKNNGESTSNLLELSVKYKIPKFIHASSSSVYGSRPCGPFKEEEDISKPISIYAATKVADEALLNTYNYLYGISCIALRFFTVYGPGQRPDLAIHKFTKLIDAGKSIQVYGDGSAERDFTYVDDTVDGIVRALDYECAYEVFNLGESQITDVNTMIQLIEKSLGKKAKIEYTDPVRGDVPITYADISKAKKLLGYNPQTKIEDGIPKFVEWFRRSQLKQKV